MTCDGQPVEFNGKGKNRVFQNLIVDKQYSVRVNILLKVIEDEVEESKRPQGKGYIAPKSENSVN